jgi:hypothetical protein
VVGSSMVVGPKWLSKQLGSGSPDLLREMVATFHNGPKILPPSHRVQLWMPPDKVLQLLESPCQVGI